MATTIDQSRYAGNILVDGLGEIPSTEEALKSLLYLPEQPRDMGGIPVHVRLHWLMDVRDIYIPPMAGVRLRQTTDLMVRQGYRYRDPRKSSTWRAVSGEERPTGNLLPQSMAAVVDGLPGVGKTQACARCVHAFPQQVIHHDTFPGLIGGLQQVVWLSVEIPPSGKAKDLAIVLMEAWDEACGSQRFSSWRSKERIADGMRALEEWRQVATAHFLGVLHLDEVQNLFKISSLKQRLSRGGTSRASELSIVEDQALRWLLSMFNRGTPLLFSGTPDGIGALSKRLSTLERVVTAGYHRLAPFEDWRSPEFRNLFFPRLARYQYVRHQLPPDDNLAKLLIDLTGGIQRVIIALWVAGHRVAFERNDDALQIEDFILAASTWLAPLAPAIAAIREKSEKKMAQYSDLMRPENDFWRDFWDNVART